MSGGEGESKRSSSNMGETTRLWGDAKSNASTVIGKDVHWGNLTKQERRIKMKLLVDGMPPSEGGSDTAHSLSLLRAYILFIIPSSAIGHIVNAADACLGSEGIDGTKLVNVSDYMGFVQEAFCFEGRGSTNYLNDYVGQKYDKNQTLATNIDCLMVSAASILAKGEPFSNLLQPSKFLEHFASQFVQGAVNDATIEVILAHLKGAEMMEWLKKADALWHGVGGQTYDKWSRTVNQLLMHLNKHVITVGNTRAEVEWPKVNPDPILILGNKRKALEEDSDAESSPKKKPATGGGREREGGSKSDLPCRFFSQAAGCRKGKDCDFKHIAAGAEKGKGGKGECFRFTSKGHCDYGDTCIFAHNGGSKAPKKEACRNFMNGKCFRHDCKFAHGEQREGLETTEYIAKVAEKVIDLENKKREEGILAQFKLTEDFKAQMNGGR